jgi:WhiB family transcriptional regulator, redox-sensing transcriptional regulator
MGVLLSELLLPGWAENGMMGMSEFANQTLPCHTVDAELFFSENSADIKYAKALCSECPMMAACLSGALSRKEPCGVWGGELFDGGKVITAKRSVGRPPKEIKQPVDNTRTLDVAAKKFRELDRALAS